MSTTIHQATMECNEEVERIRPPRPTTIDQAARNVSYPPSLSHRVGNADDPPVKPPPIPMHFGVVGEGRTKKVLAFNSMSSRSLIADDNHSDPPWSCSACRYDNVDHKTSLCSMCGTKRNGGSPAHHHSTMPSVFEEGSVESAVDKPFVPARRMSRDFGKESLRLVLSSRRLSIDPTQLENGIKEGDFGSSSIAVDLANMSLAGGWACPSCTFANANPLHLSCAVCGEKKPKEVEGKKFNGYESIHDFLSASMVNFATPGSWDPQMEAFLHLEEVATEKERMALVVEEQKAILVAAEQRTGSLQVTREELDNARETLKILEDFYRDEKTEYDAMMELQATKAAEIETVEGAAPQFSFNARATRPGAHSVTPETLQWLGQQRMLDDWKMQLNERAAEIETIRAEQKQMSASLRSASNSGRH